MLGSVFHNWNSYPIYYHFGKCANVAGCFLQLYKLYTMGEGVTPDVHFWWEIHECWSFLAFCQFLKPVSSHIRSCDFFNFFYFILWNSTYFHGEQKKYTIKLNLEVYNINFNL